MYFPGAKFLRVHRAMRLVAGAFRQLLRIEVAHIRRIRFRPACRRRFLHRDRKFRVRFAIRGEKPARISHAPSATARWRKFPQRLCPRFTARSQARFTARARSSGVSAAVRFAKRFTVR